MFLVFVTDSISSDTTIGNMFILLILCPLDSIISFDFVAEIAEHNASLFSFLFNFLKITFCTLGGCACLPPLTEATPPASPCRPPPPPRIFAILEVP